jgi:LAGLIDADG endonuclease
MRFKLQDTHSVSHKIRQPFFVDLIINICATIVKILIILNNLQVTKPPILIISKPNKFAIWLSMLVGTSEAIRLLLVKLIQFIIPFYPKENSLVRSTKLSALIFKRFERLGKHLIHTDNTNFHDENKSFNEWLAGLIDGDGCFLLSKKGYASLEITMEIRDKHCLHIIKHKFGGSVKLKSGVNWLRYRLHHKEGLLNCINAVNGLIRNPVRLLQLQRICDKYHIILKDTKPLEYNNGWLAGFLDSHGSVYLNLRSDQLFITASQKNQLLLDPLVGLYGGSIYTLSKLQAFKWSVYKKEEVLNLLNYFSINPPRSAKKNRILRIKRYYELKQLKAHRASPNSVLGKSWSNFLQKWEYYEN